MILIFRDASLQEFKFFISHFIYKSIGNFTVSFFFFFFFLGGGGEHFRFWNSNDWQF